MTLEHVGIAIAGPEQAAVFERLFETAPYKAEVVEREGVQTLFFGDGGVAGAAPKMELVESTRPDSAIARYLASRGPGLHHLAFEVADLDAEIERVRGLGIRPLADEGKPGADGKRIAFLHPKDTAGVLVELVESVRTPPEWGRVETEAGAVAVQCSGPIDAPPLLVLHGALGSTELETDRLIRLWEKGFRVVGMDMPGHGRSAALADPAPTWRPYVDAAVAVLDSVEGGPAAVFGFSMGGGVALGLAAARPDRVSRLAVHGVNVQWDRAEVDAMVGPMDAETMAASHPFWARRLAEVHGADRWQALVRQVVAFTRGLPGAPMTDAELARVVAPTLVSAGDRDRYFDVRHAVGLWRALPDARLQVVPGLDHPIQGVDVPRFSADVAAFLQGTS